MKPQKNINLKPIRQGNILRLTRVISFDDVFTQNYTRIWGNIKTHTLKNEPTPDLPSLGNLIPENPPHIDMANHEPIDALRGNINDTITASLDKKNSPDDMQAPALLQNFRFLDDKPNPAQTPKTQTSKLNSENPPPTQNHDKSNDGDGNDALSDLAAWGLKNLEEITEEISANETPIDDITKNLSSLDKKLTGKMKDAPHDPILADINIKSSVTKKTAADSASLEANSHMDIVSVDNILKNIATEKNHDANPQNPKQAAHDVMPAPDDIEKMGRQDEQRTGQSLAKRPEDAQKHDSKPGTASAKRNRLGRLFTRKKPKMPRDIASSPAIETHYGTVKLPPDMRPDTAPHRGELVPALQQTFSALRSKFGKSKNLPKPSDAKALDKTMLGIKNSAQHDNIINEIKSLLGNELAPPAQNKTQTETKTENNDNSKNEQEQQDVMDDFADLQKKCRHA